MDRKFVHIGKPKCVRAVGNSHYAAVALIFLLLAASVTYVACGKKGPGAAEKVKEKVGQSTEAVAEYSEDARNEAQEEIKTSLASLDDRITTLRDRLGKLMPQMDDSAKTQIEDAVNRIQSQREKLKENFNKLQKSSAAEWTEMRKNFQNEYDALAADVGRTEKDLDNLETQEEIK